MWQRFTERARKVVFYAQEEARRLGECNVTPSHLLLGLMRESDHVAARILDRLGVSHEMIQAQVYPQSWPPAPTLSPVPLIPVDSMQLTPNSKRVIDAAYQESKRLSNNYIGTEHLLLGLLHNNGNAGQFLGNLGLSAARARVEVAQLQGVELPKTQSLWQRLFQKQPHT